MLVRMSTTDPLQQVIRVAESELSAEDAARLPETAPAAPWRAGVEGVFWFNRAPASASSVISHGLRPSVPLGGGGFVHYPEGPVGTYREILVFPRLVRARIGAGLHVPFIAVDSPASTRGGRENWALPKVLARFTGFPGRDASLRVEGDGWWVTAQVRTLGPFGLPVASKAPLLQMFPDGTKRSSAFSARGRGQLALIDLDVDPQSSLSSFIKRGRHLGMVVRGQGYIGTADPVA